MSINYSAVHLRPKGHKYELPIGVIWSCIKNHLYPVASFAIYNFVVLYSFVFLYFTFFYIHCHILATCTFDTCFIKYRSINQSINQMLGGG